ncbi:MAG: COX15/CtaA family protein [Micromonosporaceae bacterium]
MWSISPTLVRRTAVASLVANVVIVITGGAVRLTGSGLGCPTWPRCTDDSYTSTPEMGLHGVIEFGNRTLSMIVGLIAIAALVAAISARPRRRDLTWLAMTVVILVGVQGVIGGLSVRFQLNPWVVAGHFTMSMVVIAFGYALWSRAPGPVTRHEEVARAGRTDVHPAGLPRELRWLTAGIAATTLAVLAVGTVVTGSGPHAGDPDSERIAIDPGLIAQIHADLVFLLLGLSIAGWFAIRATAPGSSAARAATLLVAAELAQGGIGFVQYFTALPVLLVGLHMAGACMVWLAALHLYATTHQPAGTAVTTEPNDRAIPVPAG